MALQVFTAGQTLTAAQMTTLQASTYNYPLSTISASTYTILSSDAGKLLLFTNNATPVGVTFPASLGMAVGDTVEIVHGGTGTLTLIADAGVTLNSEGSLLTLGTRYARISVTKTASNVFLVSWMTAITEAEITAGSVTSAKLGSGLTLAGTTTLGGATVINEIFEIATVVNAQPVATDGGTLFLDISSGAVYYYTTSTTLNIVLDIATTGFSTGQVATVVVMVTSGGAAGKITAIKIDTVLQASQAAPNTSLVKWFGGTSFPNGTGPSSVDVYTLSIFKTGATAYTTFASQSKFA